jgi:asparagine synthase (glutamine-hydrolysing)
MAEVEAVDWQLDYFHEREPRRIDTPSATVYIFGRPLSKRPIESLLSGTEATSVAKQLDGEYLLVIERDDEVTIVTDRYGSYPAFYALLDEELLLSTEYLSLWKTLRARDALVIDDDAFYEYLYFQRLFAQDTYDRRSKAVPPASVLRYDRSGVVRSERYYRPDFSKVERAGDEWAARLAETLTSAVSRRLRKDEEPGLLLSGGLDSRAVLGAFPDDVTPTCYTLGDGRNNEVEVAAELADAAGADHVFVERPDDYYERFLERSVRVGGGMYTFDHAHFFTLDNHLDVDVLFHGHGLDYLFQGMYLPTTRPSVLGHPTYFERLDEISDIVSAYTSRVPYRLDDGTEDEVILDDRSELLETRLHESLNDGLPTGRTDVSEVYDEWDYLHVDNQFRHYTHLNLLSITGIPHQTVAFDEELLSLFWSMPARRRAGASAFKQAISHLDPALARIRDANTNLPVEPSPLKLTAVAAGHAVSRRIPGVPQTHTYPSAEDRSWPDRDDLIRNSKKLQSRAEKLAEAGRLGDLAPFHEPSIEQLVADHLSGRADYGAGILSLLTIDEFLRQGGLPS